MTSESASNSSGLASVGDVVKSMTSEQIDVPDDPFADEDDDKRLWIGNLDSRMTEFAILKLVQKFGSIRKMDFIYHKSGPDKGKPRGYCFVSFHTWEAAEKARKLLDGKLALSRPMYVKWAQGSGQRSCQGPLGLQAATTSVSKCRPTELSSASSSSSTASSASSLSLPPPAAAALSLSSSLQSASTETKIQAIEAKLRLMEQTQRDFSLDASIRPPMGLNTLTTTHRANSLSTRPSPYRKPVTSSYKNKRR